jgi:pimeloyl-ACP methyl ester carboxylesterase
MVRLFFINILVLIYSHSFSQEIYGNWEGNIEVNGQQIPIVFHFNKDSSGNINGKWDSPKQNAMNLPFSSINVNKDSLHLGIKMIGGYYHGKFIGNDSVAGLWQQSGRLLDLNFSRSQRDFSTEEKPRLLPDEREISVTSYDGTVLYGTLFSKNNQEKLGIIIAGSGPTDRDGNNFLGINANSYKMLAQALDSQNIATFRYDKRGMAKSHSGNFNQANVVFEDYIKDAEKIFDYLHDSLEFKNIYIIGHSEGSLIGMIASQNEPVNGYISVAGAGRPIDAVIEERENASALPDSLKTRITIIFNDLKKGKKVDGVPAELNNLFNKSLQPYFISWLKYDPAKEIKKLSCPILILQGACDIQIKLQDAENLHSANPKSKIEIIPLMTHALKNAGAGCKDQIKTYTDPALPINMKLIREIVSFMNSDS